MSYHSIEVLTQVSRDQHRIRCRLRSKIGSCTANYKADPLPSCKTADKQDWTDIGLSSRSRAS